MSVIRKKPEINKIIEALNDTEKAKLAAEVDNEAPLYTKSLINKNYYFSPLSNNTYEIAGILLELAPTNTVPGIVIRTNNANNLREFFIQISYKQKLIMWRLNTVNRTAKMIDEELNINELRRLLEEVHDHIVASEIDSREAAANALLVADGDGGAEFVSPEDGSAQYLLGLDSQGNIVKDELPEGIVVDQTIVEDSENAVAGGAVYDALATKANASETYTKTQIDTALENKANVDGNYPTMTVGAADNLTPYDEDSGVDQEQPFLLQGTGCGNGEQQVDTGALGLLKEKQGHSVVVNQSINGYQSRTVLGITFVDNGDGTVSVSGTAESSDYLTYANIGNLVVGHKILILTTSTTQQESNDFVFTGQKILTVDGNTFTNINLVVAQGTTYNETFSTYAIDLTQWFGSNDNIPAHLLAHPEYFFRYYQGSLAYNAGTLVNANGRYLKAIGRNQWDEETKVISGELWSKNYIKVIPGATYYGRCPALTTYLTIEQYDKDYNLVKTNYVQNATFDIEPNALFIKFYCQNGYGTTYNHDITISIYYEGESGYDQYYPYEELANIDTGNEVLRSAGSVVDSKTPDGTITRRVASYTFTGSEVWEIYGTTFVCAQTVTKGGSAFLCSKSYPVRWSNAQKNQFEFPNPGWTDQADAQSKTAGMTIYYELAEPTTEQGTTFSENVAIDDFGSMDFGGTSGVPQGASIFYAVDYKAFIDSLYNTLDGDATDIVKESELDSKLATLGYVKLTSVSGYDATKTQVLKNLEGTLTWVTEE